MSRVSVIADADIGGGTLADANVFAEYTYLGTSAIVKITHPKVSGGLELEYGTGGTYGGFDRFGRVIDQTWQNRFYSCALSKMHLWRAMGYVERNPVRAKLMRRAWRHPWSSAAAGRSAAETDEDNAPPGGDVNR